MSPTPDDPSSESGGARLRARARVGAPRLRPEVSDALSGVEQSLVDVATWERLQPSPVDPPISAPPEEPDPADPNLGALGAPEPGDDDSDDDSDELPIVVGEIPPPPGAPEDEAAGPALPPELVVHLEPRAHPIAMAGRGSAAAAATGGPLLTEFLSDDSLDALRLDGPVLPSAAGVSQGYTQAQEEAEEAERRRRNGQVLTWAGVVVLAAVVLLWLVPDRSGDQPTGELPAIEATTSTTGRLLLDPNELTTTTTEAPTTTAAVVTVPSTSRTTVKRSSPGTTATTRPTATTSKAPTTTLGLPSGPTTTPSSVRPPTTTQPPTTDPPSTTPTTGP